MKNPGTSGIFFGLVHSVSLVKGNVANVHCAADEGARKRPDDGCL